MKKNNPPTTPGWLKPGTCPVWVLVALRQGKVPPQPKVPVSRGDQLRLTWKDLGY